MEDFEKDSNTAELFVREIDEQERQNILDICDKSGLTLKAISELTTVAVPVLRSWQSLEHLPSVRLEIFFYGGMLEYATQHRTESDTAEEFYQFVKERADKLSLRYNGVSVDLLADVLRKHGR